MPCTIIVGLQWGDEGKGKISDLFSLNMDYVIRAQGGANAGHTIICEEKEYKLHLIPSGIFHPHVTCILGAGMVIDPVGLLSEMDALQKDGLINKNLLLSGYAHLVMPYHKIIDQIEEKEALIGTTKKGIGPCYQDKVTRCGIRVCDLLKPDLFKTKLEQNFHLKREKIKDYNLSFAEVYDSYLEYGKKLKPLIEDVEKKIEHALSLKKTILIEGSQGTLLDISFGTYPYVTSSNTFSWSLCTSLGINPRTVDSVIGVIKAYSTRVGNGPFPTELKGEETQLFDHTTAREIGTTTGRKRRMGWFDAVLVKKAIYLNGVDFLAITKLDILDHIEKIKVCIGYKGQDEAKANHLSEFFYLDQAEPVYEELDGWLCSTKDVKDYKHLPENAKKYLDYLKKILEVKICLVSVGPKREQTLWLYPS